MLPYETLRPAVLRPAVLRPAVSKRVALRRVVTGAVALLLSAPLHAQAADTAEVVRVSQTLLRAISTRDTALARTVLLPGAVLASVVDPSSATSVARTQSDAEFYRRLTDGPEVLLERMWAPVVTFHGPLAVVRAPYDFHVNSKFSHCGTDVFTLMPSKGKWRISTVTYTVQRAGCTPAPLGPPSR